MKETKGTVPMRTTGSNPYNAFINTQSGSLNIRRQPTTHSTSVKSVPPNAPLLVEFDSIIGNDGQFWYKVLKPDPGGYASMNYVVLGGNMGKSSPAGWYLYL